MADNNKPYADADCRHCQCPEHNALSALAERRDAWIIANKLLTDAAKHWTVNADGERALGHYEVDASDVLIAANWCLYGPGEGIST
jgi:hypothetical protein